MTQKAKETFDKVQIKNRMHLRDTDRDTVPDVYDCKPYDPTQDGFFGDVFRHVVRTVRAVVSRSSAHVSSARAAVRREVTPSVRRVAASVRRTTSTIRRATRRTVAPSASRVTSAVRAVVSRAPARASPVLATSRLAAIERAVITPMKEVVSSTAEAIRTTPERVAEKQVKSIWDIKPAAERVARPATRAIEVAAKPYYKSTERALGICPAVEEHKVASQRLEEYKGAADIARVTALQYQMRYPAKSTFTPAEVAQAKRDRTEIAKLQKTADLMYTKYETASQAAEQARGTQIKFKPTTVGGYSLLGLGQWSKATGEKIEASKLPYEERLSPTPKYVLNLGKTTVSHLVQMGTLPVGLEAASRNIPLIPAAMVVGGTGIVKAAYHDPVQTAVDFILFRKVGKGISSSPIKVKPTLISLPKAKGVSIGLELRSGGVTKFKPGITVMQGAGKRVTVGTPKVPETAIIGKTLFTPKTALEAKIVSRSLGREGAKITEALKVRGITTQAKVTIKEITPTIKEVLGHHGISKKSASAVLKITKSHRGTVFGSIIQRAAGKRGLSRIPRDFDIVVKDPIKFAGDVAAKINKAEGRRVVVAKEGTVTTLASGKKLFDIHAPDATPRSYLGRSEIGYGLVPEKLIKPEGLRMRSFSEQMSRKLEGGMIVGQKRTLTSPLGSVTGRIVPKHVGRIKDILDFYTGEKLSIKQLRTRGKTTSAAKADAHLEKWLDTWGKEVAGNVRSISTTQIKAGVLTKTAFEFGTPTSTKLTTYPTPAAAAYTRTHPSVAPYTPPSVPPYVPASVPPSVAPYTPPSVPPYVPASVPPSVAPYTPPSVPPYKPISEPPIRHYTPPPPPPPTYIPKSKPKHRLPRKKKQAKPEYWQIENPIASIQDMIGGQLQQIRSPKKR